MARGLVENNPVIGTAKNEEKSRDRVLTPAEFRLIWNALEDTQHGRFIKLLALNGQRLNEIGRLRWSEVHDDQIISAGRADQECLATCAAVIRS